MPDVCRRQDQPRPPARPFGNHPARWLGALALLVALAAAAPMALAARHGSIPASSAFSLPSARSCLVHPRLTLQVRGVHGVKWLDATVKVNGRRVKHVGRAKVLKPIRLASLPRGRFVVAIKASGRHGRTASAHRTYRTCATTHPTPTPTPSPTPAPTPVLTPTPTPPPPSPAEQGSYSGSTSQFHNAFFYVTADRAHIVDVSIPDVHLSCVPTQTLEDQLAIPSITVASDGSFSGTRTQGGVISGTSAQFTYTFSGHITGTTASGSFRENLTYDDGTLHSCTSNAQTWTMSRDQQGTQTVSPPPVGSYSGSSSQFHNAFFYASADGTHLVDVSIPTVAVTCMPTKPVTDQLAIPSITVAHDGSFSGSRTQHGVLFGVPATFTYTFSGHFHGFSTSGIERAAGMFREDIAYDDGTSHTCSSDDQTWTMTRDTQGTQTTLPPPIGSYSGATSQFHNAFFYASADRTHLVDVTVPTVAIGCTPTKDFTDQLTIPSVVLNSDGSFTATRTTGGVLFGADATFKYTFTGHFHGTTSQGTERAAGTWREDISYDDGTSRTCTSNDQTWTASFDTQGSQAAAAPQSGTYGGSTSQFHNATFGVSSDHSQLQDVSVPTVGLGCVPSQSTADQLAFASIPIDGHGAFAGSATQTGTFLGFPATFTYAFSGHFHGLSSSGVQRAAGFLREDVTYDNGTIHKCTSNDQTWTATRTGP